MKPASVTWPILRPSDSRISELTTGTVTFARSSLTSRVRLPDWTVSVTLEPAGPLISAVAALEDLPLSGRPLAFVIRSPALMPPFFAGEPSKTVSTRRPSSACSTFMPTPSNAPFVASWKLW